MPKLKQMEVEELEPAFGNNIREAVQMIEEFFKERKEKKSSCQDYQKKIKKS